jgi:hypothetical protein
MRTPREIIFQAIREIAEMGICVRGVSVEWSGPCLTDMDHDEVTNFISNISIDGKLFYQCRVRDNCGSKTEGHS